jgi:hypothetical protein
MTRSQFASPPEFSARLSSSRLVQEHPMLAKLQHPETIEALFGMAGGDAKLLERALGNGAANLDSVHLLKSVEYIIEHRKPRTSR